MPWQDLHWWKFRDVAQAQHFEIMNDNLEWMANSANMTFHGNYCDGKDGVIYEWSEINDNVPQHGRFMLHNGRWLVYRPFKVEIAPVMWPINSLYMDEFHRNHTYSTALPNVTSLDSPEEENDWVWLDLRQVDWLVPGMYYFVYLVRHCFEVGTAFTQD